MTIRISMNKNMIITGAAVMSGASALATTAPIPLNKEISAKNIRHVSRTFPVPLPKQKAQKRPIITEVKPCKKVH